MEVKIGVQHAPRELVVETDETPDAVEHAVAEAVTAGTALVLTDTKGRKIVVPGAKVAYVEIGTGAIGHVGFRSAPAS